MPEEESMVLPSYNAENTYTEYAQMERLRTTMLPDRKEQHTKSGADMT